MEFYFPTNPFSQRHMHHPMSQSAFFPRSQYDDIEVVVVEEEPRQHRPLFGEGLHHHPLFREGLHHQRERLYQQQREHEIRRYRQQQREYALEQQRLREEQAAYYILYRQKEQERICRQQEQERIRRQDYERLRQQQEQQDGLYRRRIMEMLEKRERKRQQYQQHALFSFLFNDEDTEMGESRQQEESQEPQQQQSDIAQTHQEEPEQLDNRKEPEQERVLHQEPQHEEREQAFDQDDSAAVHIRFLFSPDARSFTSSDHESDQDDAMASDEEDQGADQVRGQEEMTTNESGSENQEIWEELGPIFDDEKDAETKHLQLRMLGEQLAQLDEKHDIAVPATRLQFVDDSSSEVTAISRENRQFLGLEDEVIQVMLQLDAVDSNGDESIRQERKSLIRKAEKLLAKMDEHKQQEWERISVSSASSA